MEQPTARGGLDADSKRLVRSLVRCVDAAQKSLRRRSQAVFAAQALGARDVGEPVEGTPRPSRERDAQ